MHSFLCCSLALAEAPVALSLYLSPPRMNLDDVALLSSAECALLNLLLVLLPFGVRARYIFLRR